MTYLFLFTCGALAWFYSTILAGGAATLLIPVISLLLGAQLVAPVISIAALVANPSRVVLFHKDIDWKVVSFMVPGSVIGAALGAWSLKQANVSAIQILLGLFLITYVLQEKLARSQLHLKMRLHYFFPLGLIVSYLSGLIGATGPIHNPFMLSYGLVKEKLVGTKSINSLIMQLTKLISYGGLGLLSIEIGVYGVVLGLGAIMGVYLARNQLQQLDIKKYRDYVLAFMFISGFAMLIKATG